MTAHETQPYRYQIDTMVTRLVAAGFSLDHEFEYDDTRSHTLTLGEAIAVVWWPIGLFDKAVGCVGYRGEEPDDYYWAARKIVDPLPTMI